MTAAAVEVLQHRRRVHDREGGPFAVVRVGDKVAGCIRLWQADRALEDLMADPGRWEEKGGTQKAPRIR